MTVSYLLWSGIIEDIKQKEHKLVQAQDIQDTLETERKFKVCKMYRRPPGRPPNVLWTINLNLLSRGEII